MSCNDELLLKLQRFLVMANKAVSKEYPGSIEIEVQPEIAPQSYLDSLGKKGRFALHRPPKSLSTIHSICFSQELFSMPDDMILFNVVHELLHCVRPKVAEDIITEDTFNILARYFSVSREDFLEKYKKYLQEAR